jgi:hypothetical protein
MIFISQIQRPTTPPAPQSPRCQAGTRSARRRNTSGRDVPDLDRMDPEAFVDNLEGMASAAFSNVTEEVMIHLLDLFISLHFSSRISTSPQICWKCNQRIAQGGSLPARQSRAKIWLMFRRSILTS